MRVTSQNLDIQRFGHVWEWYHAGMCGQNLDQPGRLLVKLLGDYLQIGILYFWNYLCLGKVVSKVCQLCLDQICPRDLHFEILARLVGWA